MISKIKNLSLSAKIIIFVLIFLTAAVAALAVLNQGEAQKLAARQSDATFVIKAGGVSYEITYDILQAAGIQNFNADKKSGGKPAVRIKYQGALLKDLCDSLGIDLSDAKSCVALAADGYAVAVSIDKINEPANVFVASGENGAPLQKKDDGGDGPYMIVVVKDPFSQNWCKYLSEIIFE